MNNFSLLPHQVEIAHKASEILKYKGVVLIAAWMRVGKTISALETAKILGYKKVLFLTKKGAIPSVQSDYKKAGYLFDLTVTNYQQLPKMTDTSYNAIILDECHFLSKRQKPSTYAKLVRKMFRDKPMIFLSGTPNAETAAQLYPIFRVSDKTPFYDCKDFYAFYRKYGTNKVIKTPYGLKPDYDSVRHDDVINVIRPVMVTATQEDAGFTTEVIEKELRIPMPEELKKLIDRVEKDKVVIGKTGTILADTAVRELGTIHQMTSGTVILEDGRAIILSSYKADYIAKEFSDKRIVVFHKYTKEAEMLEKALGTRYTDDIEEARKDPNKVFCVQFRKGCEGIDMSFADALVAINVDFAAVVYLQFRERLAKFDRKEPCYVYFVLSESGIDNDILKTVRAKKTFTSKLYNARIKDK